MSYAQTHATAISIIGIGTAVPVNLLQQNEVFNRIEEALQDYPDSIRWAKRIFKQCGVETRYTCEPNLLEKAGDCRYLPSANLQDVPSTSERMEIYKRESIPIALQAAREALQDAHTDPTEITHIITVSCTGQFLPGLDAILVHHLGLSPRVNRIPLTFQGCAAGLKAIQLAKQLAESTNSSNILVVCVELCTLHFQPSSSRESLFASSFFGDGASACIIGMSDSSKTYDNGVFRLGEGHSILLPDCADEMIWEVGDTGFDLYLSPNIPKLLTKFLPEEVNLLLRERKVPELWAIHPGGRGIVDAVQKLYNLTDEQTMYSRNILRSFGNVSSATILFVMQQMRQDLVERKLSSAEGIALAFGPGLTSELMKFTFMPSTSPQEAELQHVHHS
ncbi:type III polyketide synthase [Paenibacillus pini]|uniref:Chalcone synthase n=1 Tax=Paenibacillus pini JCM 16418 TaxID=1236976 RepID=W7YGL8_9BACL|nr:type III polyketide synthase [Paenibacillus pini]GAF07602.1 chalcone synthase [Paenibacillus pini JCM 16418]